MAAVGQVQQRLVRLWCEVLELDQVGATDNFFDLGGDSRLVLILVTRIRHEFGADVRHAELLASSTIEEMARLLDHPAVAYDPVPAEQASAPLSFGQEGIWALQSIDRGNLAFVLPVAIKVGPPTDGVALADAVARVIAGHEALLCTLDAHASPVGQLLSALDPADTVTVCEPVAADALADRLRALLHTMAAHIVPLDGPLARAAILPTDGGDHVVLFAAHHLAMDGTSVPLLARDLSAALDGEEVSGSDGILAFARRQRALAASPAWEASRRYWRRLLLPLPDALELPLDRPRGPRRSDRGHSVRSSLDGKRLATLDRLAAASRTSRFAVLMTALVALAHRYSGQDDVVLATPVSTDRADSQLADTVGYLVNLLPIRTQVNQGMTFPQLVDRVAQGLREAVAHSELPFEEILSELGPDRLANAALLTRLIVAQDVATGLPRRGGGSPLDEVDFDPGTAKYEISVFVRDQPGEIQLRWEFAADLLDPPTVRRWSTALDVLLNEVAGHPEKEVSSIPLMTQEDRRMITEVNRTATPFPSDSSIIDLFDDRVFRAGDAVALRHPAGHLDYRTLQAWSAQVAAELVAAGVGAETPVIVLTGRTPEFVAAVLGVLRAGGSYVPLDSRHPAERIATVCEMVGAVHAVTVVDLARLLPAHVRPVLVSAIPTNPAIGPADVPPVAVEGGAHRAYIMLTSGSTGMPKGVEIEDRSVVRLLRGQPVIPLGDVDVLLVASNLAFDAVTLELWGALLNGGTLIVPREETVHDPRELVAEIGRSGVTAGFFTVSMFRLMLEADPAPLRRMHTILIGGEAVPASLMVRAAEVLDHQTLVNGYGPTENTTFSCCHRLVDPPTPGHSVPIGHPIANSQAMVVDVDLRPVPVGVVGEIVVGGVGLARGYVGDGELTAARFVVGV
ncbi:MAG: AMP-binding protein, partial [Pseudonocardiaceae bacterium]